MPRTINFDEQTSGEKGRDLRRLVRQDIRDRRGVMDKVRITRQLYFGDNVPRAMALKGKRSDIHLYILTEKIEAAVPKISNAFFNAEPVVHMRRAGGGDFDPETTQLNEEFLSWALDNDIDNFFRTFEDWIRNGLRDGTSVLKMWWDYSERDTVEVHTVKVMYNKGEVDIGGQPVEEPRMKNPLEVLVEIFGAQGMTKGLLDAFVVEQDPEEDVAPHSDPAERLKAVAAPADALDGMAFMVDFVEDRQRYEGSLVEFESSRYIDEIQVYVHRAIVERNKVHIETVEFEDLIVPFRAVDCQTSARVCHQFWLTPAEIRSRIDTGEWQMSEEDFKVLAARGRGQRQEEEDSNKELKQQKDVIIGEDGNYVTLGALEGTEDGDPAPYADDKVLIWEIYCRDNVAGTGRTSEVIYQIPYYSAKIVQAKYLDEVYPHGRRPFAEFHNIPISDRFYGLSWGELLAPINIEVNAIVNFVNDSQEILNNPMWFYVPSAMNTDPELIKNAEPGDGIPIGDINGVMFPKFQAQPLANLSAVDSMLMYADRLTMSPQSSGSSQVRNSPRTARGTMALLSEAGIKLDHIIRAAQAGGWREMAHQTHTLYHHYAPDEIWFNVTGKDRPTRITPAQMRGKFDYKFSGNTVNTNREVMRSIAQTRYALLSSEPLFQQDMKARKALVMDVLKHFGEGTDIDRLEPSLPGESGTHPPMSQKDENQIIMRGGDVSVLPDDNHMQHLAQMESEEGSDLFEQMQPWMVMVWGQHKKQHMQFMQGQQQAGQAVPPGMANNVPGQAQGPDLGNQEGGVQ